MLGTLAFKRDQHEIWSANPMYGMYTVKIKGESKGEALSMEEETEEANTLIHSVQKINQKNQKPR